MSEILKYLKAHKVNLQNELLLVTEAIAAVEDTKLPPVIDDESDHVGGIYEPAQHSKQVPNI